MENYSKERSRHNAEKSDFDMENKVVCYYCGTIYDADMEKCPLCGSRARSEDDESAIPVQRQRLTEKERRERRRAVQGKYEAPVRGTEPTRGPSAPRSGEPRSERGGAGKYAASKKKNGAPKSVLRATVIFLALAVLVMTYFIGDMIGWWPGLEDLVEHDYYKPAKADTSCTLLTAQPETLRFTAPKETAEIKITVNAACEETVYCSVDSEKVAVLSETAQTQADGEQKTMIFTVTAAGEGETVIRVKCGKLSATASVVCEGGVTEPTEPATVDADFTPEMNYDDLTLYGKGDSTQLRVKNLPDGAAVKWTSDDATVAKVSEDGEVTAISAGSTTVTAEIGTVKVEIPVRCVFEDDDMGAHLEITDATIKVGEKFYLYLYDSDGQRISGVSYSVNNESVCTVKDGAVTGIGSGTTNVIVTFNGTEYPCIVRVR